MQPESHTRARASTERVPTQSVDTYMTQHTAPSAEAAPVVFCVYGSRRYVVAASARGSLAVACRARAALGLRLGLALVTASGLVPVGLGASCAARAQTRCEESYYSLTNKIRRAVGL